MNGNSFDCYKALQTDHKNRRYRLFSRDVTAAMLVYLNIGTAAMLVYPSNPPGIELYYRCEHFLLLQWKNKVTDHVSDDTLSVYGSEKLAQDKRQIAWISVSVSDWLGSYAPCNSLAKGQRRCLSLLYITNYVVAL